MAQTLETLIVKLQADVSGLRTGLDQAINASKNSANQVERSFGRMNLSAAKLGTALVTGATAAAGAITALGAAAIASGVKLGNYADRILDLEQQTGLTTDRLQQFEVVARTAGVPVETLANQASGLTRRLRGAGEESKLFTDNLAALGINTKNANGELRSTDDLLPEIIRSLAGMENITERNAIAFQVFGRQAEQLAPVLALGADEIDRLNEEAIALGQVLDRDTLNAANDFRIEFENLNAELAIAGREVAVVLLPILTDAARFFRSDISPAIKTGVQAVADLIQNFDDARKGVGKFADEANTGVLPAIIGLGTAFGGLVTTLFEVGEDIYTFVAESGALGFLIKGLTLTIEKLDQGATAASNFVDRLLERKKDIDLVAASLEALAAAAALAPLGIAASQGGSIAGGGEGDGGGGGGRAGQPPSVPDDGTGLLEFPQFSGSQAEADANARAAAAEADAKARRLPIPRPTLGVEPTTLPLPYTNVVGQLANIVSFNEDLLQQSIVDTFARAARIAGTELPQAIVDVMTSQIESDAEAAARILADTKEAERLQQERINALMAQMPTLGIREPGAPDYTLDMLDFRLGLPQGPGLALPRATGFGVESPMPPLLERPRRPFTAFEMGGLTTEDRRMAGRFTTEAQRQLTATAFAAAALETEFLRMGNRLRSIAEQDLMAVETAKAREAQTRERFLEYQESRLAAAGAPQVVPGLRFANVLPTIGVSTPEGFISQADAQGIKDSADTLEAAGYAAAETMVGGVLDAIRSGDIRSAFQGVFDALGQYASVAIGTAIGGPAGAIVGALAGGLISAIGGAATNVRSDFDDQGQPAALANRAPSAIRIDFTFNQQNSLGLIDDPTTRARLQDVSTDAFRQFEDVLRRNLLPRLDALEGRVFA